MLNADITELGQGTFTAVCRETGASVSSNNAEHDLCHELTLAGCDDLPIQFWRGKTPSLLYKSIHKAGRYRINMGEGYPRKLEKRGDGKAIRARIS